VNPSRPTGLVGGYNWRNVNEPGIHGSLRIFSSPPPVRCGLCREAAVIIKAHSPSPTPLSRSLSAKSHSYFFPRRRRRRETCAEHGIILYKLATLVPIIFRPRNSLTAVVLKASGRKYEMISLRWRV